MAARAVPAAEALVIGAQRLTYEQLDADVARAARALATLGVKTDEPVAVLMPNVAEWIPVTFGALTLGARVDAFNTWVKAYDLDYLLASSGATTLVLVDRVRGRDMVAELRTLLPEIDTAGPAGLASTRYPALRHVVVVGENVPSGAQSWSSLLAEAAEGPLPETTARGDETAFVLYTSGSTRNPKAVPLRHRDLIVNGFHIGERMGLTEVDRIWFGSPLFWSFGCANALMATMTHRACFVLQQEFDAVAAAELMARERVTATYLLPPMVNALIEQGAAASVRAVESLRTGVMIGRPEEIERAAVELGINEICNIYGSTETYGNCCVTDHTWPLARRMVTQGEPLPGVSVRVVDGESGEPLPAGVPGEMQVRGRVTPGYLNDDEANAEAFTPDGWFRTGDRMLINEDGTVAFVGRASDMIKTSGINVSPAEVESFLSTHPDIAESIVLGAPHPTRDEVVVAFVVPRTPSLTEDDVIAYCKERLSGYKVPWVVSIVAELPRTGTGKLVRKDLLAPATAIVEAALSRGVV